MLLTGKVERIKSAILLAVKKEVVCVYRARE